MVSTKRGWQENLSGLLEPGGECSGQLELTLYRFGVRDVLLVGFSLLLLIVTLR
jgi:hypothetical protein